MTVQDDSYDAIRLTTPDGTVIAYFAPVFEVTPQDQNDIFEAPRGGGNGSAIVRDNGLWTSELTVQGTFHHSETLSGAFRTALQDLFGQQTVTPDDQVNRLRSHTVYAAPQTLNLYHRETEYTATVEDDLDIENGIYPAVGVSELRVPEDGETSGNQIDFLVRLSVGLERSSNPDGGGGS